MAPSKTTVSNNLRDTFKFDFRSSLRMNVSFVADWSIRHRINVKVSRKLLRTVKFFSLDQSALTSFYNI